jgi:hypothetical protein
MSQTLTIFLIILNITYFCNLANILHLSSFADCYCFVIFANLSIFFVPYWFAKSLSLRNIFVQIFPIFSEHFDKLFETIDLPNSMGACQRRLKNISKSD